MTVDHGNLLMQLNIAEMMPAARGLVKDVIGPCGQILAEARDHAFAVTTPPDFDYKIEGHIPTGTLDEFLANPHKLPESRIIPRVLVEAPLWIQQLLGDVTHVELYWIHNGNGSVCLDIADPGNNREMHQVIRVNYQPVVDGLSAVKRLPRGITLTREITSGALTVMKLTGVTYSGFPVTETEGFSYAFDSLYLTNKVNDMMTEGLATSFGAFSNDPVLRIHRATRTVGILAKPQGPLAHTYHDPGALEMPEDLHTSPPVDSKLPAAVREIVDLLPPDQSILALLK